MRASVLRMDGSHPEPIRVGNERIRMAKLQRRGSIVAVIWVGVVLGIMGMSAATLSRGMGRREFHQGMREGALEVARLATEEAALLVNNGKVSLALDDSALEELAPVEVPVRMTAGRDVEVPGIPAGMRPRVLVRAGRIGPDELARKVPPKEQLEQVLEEIETKGYDEAKLEQLRGFWNDVGRELGVDKESIEKARNRGEAPPAPQLDSEFWNWSQAVGIERWMFASKSGDHTTPKNSAGDDSTPLQKVAKLFYKPSAGGPAVRRTDGFDLEELKEAWGDAMRSVGQDAAQRMASCGANPALAIAHLVGDLRTGALISSDTEVTVTSSFLRSKELGADKTYLLEISAIMGFGGEGAAGMGGEVHHTTYRLFQKLEWEAILDNMTASLVRSLQAHDVSPHQIAEMFPPDESEARRNLAMPGSGVRYDPLKVLIDPIYAELPSTSGSRLYPFPVASTQGLGVMEGGAGTGRRTVEGGAREDRDRAGSGSAATAGSRRAGSGSAE